MRRLISALALSAILYAGSAFAESITAASSIDAVTVYPTGAVVTRTVTLDLPEGQSTVAFENLPMGLDSASLRVEATGENKILIGGVSVATVAAPPQPESDGLADRLRTLNEERTALTAEIAALQGEKAMIQQFAQSGPDRLGEDGKALPIGEWPNAWAAVRTGLGKVEAELGAVQARLANVEEEIRAAGSQTAAPAPSTSRRADVTLTADGDGSATIKVSYRVPDAAWRPVYDAALDTTDNGGTVTLARRALVTQRTGEIWRDVTLTLSTARAAEATGSVALDTLHVDFAQPVQLEVAKAANAPAGGPRVKRVEALEPAQQKAVETVANNQVSAYGADFVAPMRVTVFDDGTERSTLLSSRTVPANLTLKSAPAVDAAAYLEATFANDGDAPILPGDVSILRDGVYVGAGALGFVAAGESATLGFGPDDRVKVTRAPVSRKENEPTWFNQSRVETREFKTTVKNLHGFPVSVQVVDQLPVSQNAAISVELAAAATPPTDKAVDGKAGVLGWTLDLKPNEAKDVHFAYKLKWPGDRDLEFKGTTGVR